MKRTLLGGALLCAALWLAACGGGGEGGGGGAAVGTTAVDPALQAEVERLFPYTPDQPLDVTFVCSRSNSRLTYYVDLDPNFGFTVFFETDTYQQVSFSGTYTHANGAIRLVALNNNILPLDETSTRIVAHLGMVGEFTTANMACGAVSHGYNDPAIETFKSYDCPLINIAAETDEDNSIEFTDASSPFPVVFRGGVFRQRDVNIRRSGSASITRGWGIFRRVGDTFYADFGSQFADHNLLKGGFENADRQLVVEQLEPAAGACNRR